MSEAREPSYLIPGRQLLDRHGPFAYFCVTAIVGLAIFAPATITAAAYAIGGIYGARAIERGSWRAAAAFKAGEQRESDRQKAERA